MHSNLLAQDDWVYTFNSDIIYIYISAVSHPIIWKSDLSYKIKWDFFQAAVASILLNGWTTWTLTTRRENKLDRNCTITLLAT